MGLSVQREWRGADQVTVISGEVEGSDVVDEIVNLVRLVAQGEDMTIDMSRLSGLDDRQRDELVRGRRVAGDDRRLVSDDPRDTAGSEHIVNAVSMHQGGRTTDDACSRSDAEVWISHGHTG